MARDERPDGAVYDRRPLPFSVTEYGEAERDFVWEAMSEVARRGHPLLARIPVARASGPIISQYTTVAGEVTEASSEKVEAQIRLSRDEIAAGRPGPLIDQIAEAAESHQTQLLGILFRSIDHVTEATGNRVDASGRPFVDAFCEMLEKLELRFDDDGNIAEGTTLVMHPETYARISANPENWTPEAEARVQAILTRKREEFRARQRDRRVS